ncbi:MAG: FHA domain-containing protein [Chloroflexi bacterium]|nr:FHA domain-containing protein [Chloroflexota bacterium]
MFILLWGAAVSVMAQETSLDLSTPDTSEFPVVRVKVRALGADNRPLTDAELETLRLRENGVPISDFELRYVPVGSDLIFVIDADETLLLADVDETTRLQMVREMIGRYTSRFMSPAGLDRVSVIVPSRGNTRGEFLVEDAATPEEIVNALADYDPQNLAETGPVHQQILQAIDHAADIQQDGRYQAIFLLSEARRLSEFLEYEELTTAAQSADVPIFVGILGPEASLEDIGNSAALADPSGGFHVHMPRAERADPVFLRWQQESNQPQITYRSLLQESGTYPIAVNLGPITAAVELALIITPPDVVIVLDRSVVRRAGTAVDTPLNELQPTMQPIPVQIRWADGLPRRLTDVLFTVNNVRQPLLDVPQPDEKGQFQLEWLVQNEDVGIYELVVEVADELGFTAMSEPLIVTIAVDRPDPPTPTPIPTPTPGPVEQVAVITAVPRNDLLLVLAGLGLLGLLLVMLRGYKRYRQRVVLDEARSSRRAALQRIQQIPELEPGNTTEPLYLALLLLAEDGEVGQHFPINGDNVTMGREATAVDLPLDDRSVSPLHGRIRQRNGRYWLYDEGSESGTFLNHERLGLAPCELTDGDLLQIGRFRWRVQLSTEVDEVTEDEAFENEEALDGEEVETTAVTPEDSDSTPEKEDDQEDEH